MALLRRVSPVSGQEGTGGNTHEFISEACFIPVRWFSNTDH